MIRRMLRWLLGVGPMAAPQPATTLVRIPMMITIGMRRQLRTLGWTDGEIDHLTPSVAHVLIRRGKARRA